jgi:hypothetical protein
MESNVMDNTNTENELSEKLRVFISNIVFNDGTKLPLVYNSIVIFTGANNCGKSQVLKDIEHWFDSQWSSTLKVVADIVPDFSGNINDDFLKTRFRAAANGNLNIYESLGYSYQKNTVVDNWNNKSLPAHLHKLFVKLIDTEQRLVTSKSLQRSGNPEGHSIYHLYKSEELSETISIYFKQAFGVDLVVNRQGMTDIPLHVGDAPDKNKYTIANQDAYYAEVMKLECLEAQGDGMRSFASVLLDTFTSEYTITLIDEPEAFLHPPQARLLGKMLAKNNPNNRQLFVSTHSEDFLQGLLDADSENTTVIRINRKGNINCMSILQNSEVKRLWSNPILRYSNILSGLFHEKVIVCESDYDCLFYQAVMNAIYEKKNEVAPDMLFTHCGGKGRMKDVVRALRALKVTIVAIPDFDIINNRGEFKPLVEAFDIEWNELQMKNVYDWLNNSQNCKANIKRQGKNALDNGASVAYDQVEQTCRSAGLFIVPCGEMECFHKNNLSKADWVYNELENSELATDSKLSDAREFVLSIINF